jgi:hypothetical protein
MKLLKLKNGSVVKLEVFDCCVKLTSVSNGEWVSFNPSMNKTGLSDVDTSHVLVKASEVYDYNNEFLVPAKY